MLGQLRVVGLEKFEVVVEIGLRDVGLDGEVIGLELPAVLPERVRLVGLAQHFRGVELGFLERGRLLGRHPLAVPANEPLLDQFRLLRVAGRRVEIAGETGVSDSAFQDRHRAARERQRHAPVLLLAHVACEHAAVAHLDEVLPVARDAESGERGRSVRGPDENRDERGEQDVEEPLHVAARTDEDPQGTPSPRDPGGYQPPGRSAARNSPMGA